VSKAPPPNKRFDRTRHERASLLSCVGEPLKRSVSRLFAIESYLMKNCITLMLLVILAVSNLIAFGQQQDWHVYLSVEDKFAVALPSAVQITKTGASKNEASLDPDQRGSLDSYISTYEDKAQESKFRILIINGRAKMFESMSRDSLLTYFSVMIIGDDDEPQSTSEKVIDVNGLKGKEYVWAMESKIFEYGRSNEIFRRGRIFDSGDKIYVVVFVGENAADLKSPIAERFLNSFRLSKQ
jgi:hypothetical protein